MQAGWILFRPEIVRKGSKKSFLACKLKNFKIRFLRLTPQNLSDIIFLFFVVVVLKTFNTA